MANLGSWKLSPVVVSGNQKTVPGHPVGWWAGQLVGSLAARELVGSSLSGLVFAKPLPGQLELPSYTTTCLF